MCSDFTKEIDAQSLKEQESLDNLTYSKTPEVFLKVARKDFKYMDLDIKPFQVGQSAKLQHGTDRHESFLRGQYDVAEFSMSSFLAAKTRG